MSGAAPILAISDPAIKAFEDMKLRRKHRYVLFCIKEPEVRTCVLRECLVYVLVLRVPPSSLQALNHAYQRSLDGCLL